MNNEALKQKIYKALICDIVNLILKPNDFISESSLAKRHGVSRTPVREVLKRLALEKYIVVIPHYGNKVSRIDLENVRQLLEMRILLEARVLKLVGHGFLSCREDLAKMLQNQKIAVQAEALDAFWEEDNDFHKTLFVAAGKPLWWEMLKSFEPHYMRYRKLDMTDANHQASLLLTHHESIFHALENQDELLYEPLIASHANLCLQRMPELQERYPDYFI
jgi:DNA-binding GntR family transcriptional regulator